MPIFSEQKTHEHISHNLDPIADLLRAQAQQQMKTTRRRVEVANKVTEINTITLTITHMVIT